MSKLAEITDAGFREATAQGCVLVDFWAPWCGPCKALSPVLETAAAEFGDKVRIVKMDIDANPDTATDLGIMSIPALVLFRDGQVAARTGNPGGLSGVKAFLTASLA
ncbi:thioredoxin [Mesoterricola sediminis]|uniref:Thioredoxin n=1 Tax=Mesoterricola sediminis TaxID=2927980 RepID=A0AA48KFG8_9BACT|nr:thioredoxin [Mesoterricola sediminis]BDU76448.1 thioredoxin [Mesoterricola sediminis]